MKVISKARQARLDYQSRVGHPVPLSAVAEKAGVDRMALTRLETRTRLNRVDMDMIAKLCAFYGVEIRELPVVTRAESESAQTGSTLTICIV
jgi:transcriptional regulator with XRE-family HTH domain